MANKKDLAEAQFVGFQHGKHGYSVKELVQSMGLKKSEWLDIREHITLSVSDMQDVDNYFKLKF